MKIEDALMNWNNVWKENFKKVRLEWIYAVSEETLHFFENAEIIGAISPKNYHDHYGNVLMVRVDGFCYLIREFIIQIYHTKSYFLKFEGVENSVSTHFHLNFHDGKLVQKFLSSFPFEEACDEISSSSTSLILYRMRKEFVGQSICDILYEKGSYYFILSNGEKIKVKEKR